MTQYLYSITASIAGSDLPPMTFIVSAASELGAIDAATYDAIQNGVDEALLSAASFSALDISQFALEFVDEQLGAYVPSLFERCVEAACGDVDVARDVIQTLIDNTESSYTIDELSLVLSEEA